MPQITFSPHSKDLMNLNKQIHYKKLVYPVIFSNNLDNYHGFKNVINFNNLFLLKVKAQILFAKIMEIIFMSLVSIYKTQTLL